MNTAAPIPNIIRTELKGCMVSQSTLRFYYNLINAAGKEMMISFDVEAGLSVKAAHERAAEMVGRFSH
ncbi:hypothetical protein R50073_11570 [Maricurvus nonylphenolicus]|uniref:hypothetical protein n=1 Tax=Maricurvus nonylphenolicus TaxID=1008307 RepID=UPI0036F27DE8